MCIARSVPYAITSTHTRGAGILPDAQNASEVNSQVTGICVLFVLYVLCFTSPSGATCL